MGYDKRITDIAAEAALAASKNANCPPQLLMADITFALVDAVESGHLLLPLTDAAPAIEAAAWLRECSDWLLENDLDMVCPMETDPLDLADRLAPLPTPAESERQQGDEK